MKQESQVSFSNENKTINLFCDNKTPLGLLHDFLMSIKGEIVDRMVKAHQEEQKAAQDQTDKSEAA
jgi:hypothetical protein